MSLDLRTEMVPSVDKAYQVFSGWMKADGSEITFYATMPEGSTTWILQDACTFLKDAWQAGVVLKPMLLKSLANSYGLKLTEDLALFDDTPGDLPARKWKFAQCMVAMDGCLRMWGVSAPIRINPEMEKSNE
jgi:hypothetical protein